MPQAALGIYRSIEHRPEVAGSPFRQARVRGALSLLNHSMELGQVSARGADKIIRVA